MTVSFLPWVNASHIALVGFHSSMIAGCTLTFLNLFFVSTVFGAYKYLIVIFTSLGIIFASLEVIFYPNMHSYNSATIYFTLNKPFNLIVYTGFYSATICLIAIQLLYRYWTVFDVHKLRFFQGCYVLLCVLYVLCFGALWAFGAYNFVKTDSIAEDYFRKEMLLRYNANMETLPSLAMVAFNPVNGKIRWGNLMTIVNMSFIMSIQYGIMIYCGWSMYSKMELKLQSFSVSTKIHHRQLFKTLYFNYHCNTNNILFVPLSFIIYLPFFNMELSIPTGVLLSGFSLYPAVDSVVVMYIVAEYRKRLK
ncbi:CRE-STR-10 protein [Caenorhabditis remanei]|uniref:CRE-STR-10 protein n=1 Tax=Caenorhabditis remanei TaxID=31234 RepID=E3MJQ0_CAERE|nr:CRE-STR-10 protein [Caenorhabditis remanei]